MHNIPLTADNIVFARPKPESVAAFHQARTEWTGGVRAERRPWGGDNEMTETMLATVGSDDLELADFLEEAGEDGREAPGWKPSFTGLTKRPTERSTI
ncbi:MAG TPA: hypothetical protein VNY10_22350 [Roseiarcus sp.]|nr:hypothetical protein [Roseiarcus sp.]